MWNEGYISLHPAGIPHGPHPGAMESSIGQKKQMSLLSWLILLHR